MFYFDKLTDVILFFWCMTSCLLYSESESAPGGFGLPELGRADTQHSGPGAALLCGGAVTQGTRIWWNRGRLFRYCSLKVKPSSSTLGTTLEPSPTH